MKGREQMYQGAERLLQLIAEGNPFQARYIDKMKREVMERREFEILEFLVQFFVSMELLSDSRLRLIWVLFRMPRRSKYIFTGIIVIAPTITAEFVKRYT